MQTAYIYNKGRLDYTYKRATRNINRTQSEKGDRCWKLSSNTVTYILVYFRKKWLARAFNAWQGIQRVPISRQKGGAGISSSNKRHDRTDSNCEITTEARCEQPRLVNLCTVSGCINGKKRESFFNPPYQCRHLPHNITSYEETLNAWYLVKIAQGVTTR
jgi:hypothetical protein